MSALTSESFLKLNPNDPNANLNSMPQNPVSLYDSSFRERSYNLLEQAFRKPENSINPWNQQLQSNSPISPVQSPNAVNTGVVVNSTEYPDSKLSIASFDQFAPLIADSFQSSEPKTPSREVKFEFPLSPSLAVFQDGFGLFNEQEQRSLSDFFDTFIDTPSPSSLQSTEILPSPMLGVPVYQPSSTSFFNIPQQPENDIKSTIEMGYPMFSQYPHFLNQSTSNDLPNQSPLPPTELWAYENCNLQRSFEQGSPALSLGLHTSKPSESIPFIVIPVDSSSPTPTPVPSTPKDFFIPLSTVHDNPTPPASEPDLKYGRKRKYLSTPGGSETKQLNGPLDGRRKSGKELLTEEEKRANHIASEQKRRNTIRLGFENLTELVPGLKSGSSKSTILSRTVDFIRSLEQSNMSLKEEYEMLMSQLEMNQKQCL